MCKEKERERAYASFSRYTASGHSRSSFIYIDRLSISYISMKIGDQLFCTMYCL